MKRNLIAILLLLLGLLAPTIAHAEGVIVADDTVAGLGTQVMLHGFKDMKNASLLLVPERGPTISLSIHLDPEGGATLEIPGEKLQIAGTYRVLLTENGIQLPGETTLTVLPEHLDPQVSRIEVSSPTIQPNGQEEVTVTVTAYDRFGNALAHRPFELLSNRPKDAVHPLEKETGRDGTQRFTLSTQEPGVITLRAIDLLTGNALSSSTELQAGFTPFAGLSPYFPFPYPYPYGVPYAGSLLPYSPFQAQAGTFDIIDHFEITAPSELPANVEAQRVTITAVDTSGRTVENYLGTVTFSSTDPLATLPAFGKYTFIGRDLGRREFSLALKMQTPGPQKFRVEDMGNPEIFGEVTITVTGEGVSQKRDIEITSHTKGQTISSPNIVLEGKGPPFVNLIVTGGMEDVRGETDQDGHFAIPVALNPAQRDFTLRIRDQEGRYDSGSLHLIIDTDPPLIGSITFNPLQPAANTDILVVVQSEPQLQSVTLAIQNPVTGASQEVTLSEQQTASGTYQALLRVPQGGAYQPILKAKDGAGNTTEVRTALTVLPDTLPAVQNVRAEGEANAVKLSWDPIVEPVDGYRIYGGREVNNFEFHLDTGKPITSATISSLLTGTPYYFAVTALKGPAEGVKSQVVEVRTLGLELRVTPGESSLFLEWPTLPRSFPVASFILEYGVEKGAYTEKRTLDGEARTYTMRDLLNGVTYELRLTPVSVTGEIQTDLATTASGTPQGLGGFKPATVEPVALPFEPPSRETLHSGAPLRRPPSGVIRTPRPPRPPITGLPAISLTLGGGVLIALLASFAMHFFQVRRAQALIRAIHSRHP